jgi:type IV pilus assembly protein PilE
MVSERTNTHGQACCDSIHSDSNLTEMNPELGKIIKTSRQLGFAHTPGFTLIELMMVVAVVAILGAIALPAYVDFVVRGKIPDSTSNLAAKRVQMEQFYQDNRTYAGAPACASDTGSSKYFTFSCSVAGTATVFTLQAAGTGTMAGFAYTIDQSGSKATGAVPSGWTLPSPNTCWVTAKGGRC